jgi:hypothetical protein
MKTRRNLLIVLAASALAAGRARAQLPPPGAPGSLGVPAREHVGPLRHVGREVHEHFIGDPDLFNVPPAGYSAYATMAAQVGKANLHTFTLYRSDFISGTGELSPSGAWRLSFLASRLPTWTGPVVVEWTPDQPALAAARRDAVLGLLRGSNIPVADNRVVVGPSAFPGIIGVDAANNYNILIQRDIRAPRTFSVSPRATATFAGGAR